MGLQEAIIVMLVILALLMGWAIVEIRSLRAAVQPIGTIADSPLGRVVAGLGA